MIDGDPEGDDTILTGGGGGTANGADHFARQDQPAGGDDSIVGGDDAMFELLAGNGGDDTIRDGGGAAQINGEHGDDLLFGGPGDEGIHGGAGRDTITGGTGNDFISGDLVIFPVPRSANHFVFDDGSGMDTISDFNLALAVIVLRVNINDTAIDTPAEAVAAVQGTVAAYYLDLGGGNRVALNGITLGTPTAGNFSFSTDPGYGDLF